jgi:hypothetical protein
MRSLTKPTGLRAILFLGLLAWLLIASAYHGAVSPTAGVTGVDFHVFYDAAGRLNHGQTLYLTSHDLYVYSPLFALLLRPLALLPYNEALHLWYFVGAGALALSIALFARAARLTLLDVLPLGLMLLVGFRFWPSTMNFGLGQANFLLLALLCGMYWADSEKKPYLFVLLLVLGALVKVWMLGFLLYLLLKRDWKPALVGLGGFAAALGALFSVIGWREWPLFLQAGAAAAKQIADHQVRQSIVGFADLHFRANPLIQPLADSRLLLGVFVLACAAAIGSLLVFVWRQVFAPHRSRSLYQERLVLGLVVLSVLLLLPPFENEYLVLCLPLLWTLLLAPSGTARQPWLLPGALVVYLIFNRGWPVYPPISEAFQHGLRSLLVSMDFFGAAALWLLAALALRLEASADPAARLPEHAEAPSDLSSAIG